MSDASNIVITVEGQAVTLTVDEVARVFADLIKQAGTSEKAVQTLMKAVSSLGNVIKGVDADKLGKTFSTVGGALSGSFSEAGLRVKALQGQILELKATTEQTTASLLRAQTAAARNVAGALKESQIQGYARSGNAGFQSATSMSELQLRTAAERRKVNSSVLATSSTPVEEGRRLAQLEAQLTQMKADEARRVKLGQDAATQRYHAGQLAAAPDEMSQVRTAISANRDRLRTNSVLGVDSSQEVANLKQLMNQRRALTAEQKAGTAQQRLTETLLNLELQATAKTTTLEAQKLKVLSAEKILRAEITKSAGVETESVRGARDQLAAQNVAYKDMQTGAKKPQAAPATPEEQASRSVATRRAYFNLNGGADVFKLQAQLLANYGIVRGIISGVQEGVKSVVDFEAAMKELQARTSATGGELATLGQRFLDISTNSRFSATEIANAATTMGRAGMSASQIKESIGSIVQLAQATGTDLKESVDLATSAMNVFNLRASEMGNVSNIVSAAVNASKLGMSEMATGIQYAGNAAAKSGMSFLELSSTLAAMANQGVKSGSLLGSGLRQVILQLDNPSVKLKATLDLLGLTLSDIDLRSQGLFGVLSNLQSAGFTAADAIAAMGIRGGAAFTTLLASMHSIGDMEKILADTGDVAKANSTAMDSVQSQWLRAKNTATSLAVSISGPLMGSLKGLLGGLGDVLGVMKEWSGTFSVVATALGGVAVAGLTIWIGRLAFGLTGIKALTKGVSAFAETIGEGRGLAMAFGALETTLGPVGIAMAALTAAFAIGAVVWNTFRSKVDSAAESLDKIQTAIDDSDGRLKNYETTAKSVGDEINKLAERHSRLTSHSSELSGVITELNDRFKDTGLYINQNIGSVDALIAKLKQLQNQELDNSKSELTYNVGLQKSKLGNLEQTATASIGLPGATAAASKMRGFSTQSPADAAASAGYTGPGFSTTPEVSGPSGVAKDAIQTIFGLQGTDLTNPDALSSAIGKLRGAATKVNDKKLELERAAGGVANDATQQLSNLGQILDNDIKALSNVQGQVTTISMTNQKLTDVGTAQSPLGESIRAFQTQAASKLSGVEASFTGTDHGKVTDQMKKDHAQNLANLYKQLTTQYQSIIKGASDSAVAAAGGTEAKQTLEEIYGKAQSAGVDVNTIQKELLQQRQKDIQAQISSTMGKVGKQTPLSTVAGLSGTVKGQYGQLTDTEVQLNQIKDKITAATGGTETNAETDTEIKARLQTEEAEKLKKINDYLAESNRAADLAVDASKDAPSIVKDLAEKYKEITKNFDQANKNAEAPVKIAQAHIQGLQSRLTGGDIHVTNEEIQNAKDTLPAANKTADLAKQKNLEELIQAIKDVQARTKAAIAADDAKIEALRAIIQNPSSGMSGEDRTTAIKKLDKTVVQKNSLTQQYAGRDTTLNNQQETLNSTTDINATKYAPEAGSLSVGQALDTGMTHYLTATGRMKDSTTQLADSFQSMFTTVDGAFSKFTTNLVSHTMTVRQAFASMATDILQQMLKLATNALVGQMMGAGQSLFGGMFGGMFGGSSLATTGTAAAGASAVTELPYRLGGLVHMARGGRVPPHFQHFLRRADGGGVSGGVPGRDSVPTLTMPGEFVIQKSATDALGSGFLSRLNSMGPRAMDTQVPMPGQRASQSVVNVYAVAPQNVPPPSETDIIHYIGNDIMRNGQTRKLIRSVVSGG
jgi:TP901 family phage tail tape measure protein